MKRKKDLSVKVEVVQSPGAVERLEFGPAQEAVIDRLKKCHSVLRLAHFRGQAGLSPFVQGEQALIASFLGWGHSIHWPPVPQQANLDEWLDPEKGELAYCLLRPPYGLFHRQDGQVQAFQDGQKLFTAFCKQMVELPGRACLYSWGNKWSDYFDDGHEWWGAYSWTLHHGDLVTVIAASATD